MSVLKSCPYCGGHGYINQFEDIEGGCRAWSKTCIACNGTGTILCQETNADRIRAMSDEELSEFISRIEIGDFGQQVYGKTFCDMCKGQYECDDCRLWWLQQPAKEDT